MIKRSDQLNNVTRLRQTFNNNPEVKNASPCTYAIGLVEQKGSRVPFSPAVSTMPRGSTPRCARSGISTRQYNFVSSRSFALRGASRICNSELKIFAAHAKNCRPWRDVALKERMLKLRRRQRDANRLSNVKRRDRVSSLSRCIDGDCTRLRNIHRWNCTLKVRWKRRLSDTAWESVLLRISEFSDNR